MKCCNMLDRIDELNEQLRLSRREIKVLKRKIHHYIFYDIDNDYYSSDSDEDIKYDSFLVRFKIKYLTRKKY